MLYFETMTMRSMYTALRRVLVSVNINRRTDILFHAVILGILQLSISLMTTQSGVSNKAIDPEEKLDQLPVLLSLSIDTLPIRATMTCASLSFKFNRVHLYEKNFCFFYCYILMDIQVDLPEGTSISEPRQIRITSQGKMRGWIESALNHFKVSISSSYPKF